MEEKNNTSYRRAKGAQFERQLYEHFKSLNYTVLRSEDYDHGIDLILYKPETKHHRIGIQAKNFWIEKLVTPKDITSMLPARDTYYLEELWIITTSTLTTRAKEIADNFNIRIFENFKFYTQDTLKIPITDVLIQSLKAKRKEIAEKHGYPELPYLIFDNLTLQEIATVQPKTKTELLRISGIGKKRYELFGQQIIDFFKNYDK